MVNSTFYSRITGHVDFFAFSTADSGLPEPDVDLIESKPRKAFVGTRSSKRRRYVLRYKESLSAVVEEPGVVFGLINPNLDQAVTRHIAALFADSRCEMQEPPQFQIVGAQLGEHLFCGQRIAIAQLRF